MGLILECEWCGDNPSTDDFYECMRCGQEFCDCCIKEEKNIRKCKECNAFYCDNCVAQKKDKSIDEYDVCGSKV